jgi:hypothetical protein
MSTVNRLLNIGFIAAGHCTLQDQCLKFNLSSHHKTNNLLYSFTSNGEIKYIGKTVMSLAQTMWGYQNPAPPQATNIRVNGALHKLLDKAQPVDIFILADTGLFRTATLGLTLRQDLRIA